MASGAAAQRERVVTVTLNPALDWTLSVPGLRPGHLNAVAGAEMRPGGKGVNVALALADFGVPVTVTGVMGADNDTVFRDAFAGRGVEDRFVRVPGSCRTGIKVVDPDRQETTDLNFPGRPCAAPELSECEGVLRELARGESGWFVLAGSLPPGVPPTVYRDWTQWLKAGGHQVAVDASGEALRHAVEAGPDLIKPNHHELGQLAGRPLPTLEDVVEVARGLVGGGVGWVAVSRGEAGACLVTESGVVTVNPVRVTAGSSVGAGDAMVAGLVSARRDGLTLAASAVRGTAFSLAVLTGRVATREAVAAWSARVSTVPPAPDQPN